MPQAKYRLDEGLLLLVPNTFRHAGFLHVSQPHVRLGRWPNHLRAALLLERILRQPRVIKKRA
jgi:hypothetical protein